MSASTPDVFIPVQIPHTEALTLVQKKHCCSEIKLNPLVAAYRKNSRALSVAVDVDGQCVCIYLCVNVWGGNLMPLPPPPAAPEMQHHSNRDMWLSGRFSESDGTQLKGKKEHLIMSWCCGMAAFTLEGTLIMVSVGQLGAETNPGGFW